MSIPHIFLTASGPSPASSTPITSRKLQPPDLSANFKENIRERLNMHVKKRIQGQDTLPQYSVPSSLAASPLFSATPMSTATHPFLMSGTSVSMAPMVVFANSLISVASEFSNGSCRTIPIPQIDRQSSKTKQQPKKLTKKKKGAGNKRKTKHVDANQQAENLILNTKFSDDSNEFHDRHELSSNLQNGSSSPQTNISNEDSPPVPYEKQDQRLSNTPDILSMVLSLKKNALMHDPYVIQFISAIR